MKLLNFTVSSLSIYLSKDQISLLKNNKISNNLLNIFFDKIRELFGEIPIFTNTTIHDRNQINVQILEFSNELDFLNQVKNELPHSKSGDPDIDEVFIAHFQGIYPLLSMKHTKELMERHIKYLSQYSFSENLPLGIVPFYLSREFIQSIPPNLNTPIHDYLMKNINQYDTEIYFIMPDLRQYRFDFSLSDLRSIKTTEKLIQIDKNLEYELILPTIKEHPEIFRLSPSYLELEIFGGCNYKCTFCPRQYSKNSNSSWTLPMMQSIISQIETDFTHPITYCFGGLGEPLLHPELTQLINSVVRSEFTKELIIETSLYPNLTSLENYLSKLDEGLKKKISFIINLTTLDSSKYKKLYEMNIELDEILNKINTLAKVIDKKNINVQILKILEVEEEIETYYNYFEKLGFNIVIQKYNRHINLMPEKRISNLTPIKREFCWHLTRDLYINSDGSVSSCKQELQKVLGNIKDESLKNIWEKGFNSFKQSILGNHENTGLNCINCDEWYTFNA